MRYQYIGNGGCQDLTGLVDYSFSFPFPVHLHYQGMGKSPVVPCPLWLSLPQGKQFPLLKHALLPCLVITLPFYYLRLHNNQACLDATSVIEML